MVDKLKQMDEDYERERDRNTKKLSLADFLKFAYDNLDEKSVKTIMLEWIEKN